MSPIKSSSASAQRKSPRRRPRQEVSAILGQYSGGFGYGGMSGSTGIIPHASYEQIKKAEERKRALELATIRREDAIIRSQLESLRKHPAWQKFYEAATASIQNLHDNTDS